VQERERQVAENEVRFRALNERLRERGATWTGDDGALELVCECGDEDCTEALSLTPREYEDVRAVETQFALLPGHVRPDVEDVIADHGVWVTVRKRGEAGEIAAAADPRS
jgi:hypothetical protein